MPYPKKLLNDYETVALDLHPHWWFFAESAIALVLSIAFGIAAWIVLGGSSEEVALWLALALIVGSVLWLVSQYAKWATTNFVITSDRIIFRSGVVAKSGIEIPLERVNNVLFSQTLFERLLGAGDLLIESGGEAGQQRFTDIRNPDEVQNLIHSQMEANSIRMFGGGNRDAGSDYVSQLERLEAMLERGNLTREEFERQKRKLLGD